MLMTRGNEDLVHHLLLHECNPAARFNDSNLLRGLCDDIDTAIQLCTSNIATGWAVGADYVNRRPGLSGIDGDRLHE